MTENPYASPECGSPGITSEETASGDSSNFPGCARFVLHMVVAAILAPAAGGAILNYFCVEWREAPLPLVLIGSVIGGFMLLFFIWFITVPFGLLTYGICAAAQKARIRSRWIWLVAGTLTGLAFGLLMVSWAHIPLTLMAIGGSFIGLSSGAILRRLWMGR